MATRPAVNCRGGIRFRWLRTALVVVAFGLSAFAQPVTICPSNPHYFFYNQKPLVFVTSDHHYGAVIDRDFDFVAYLDFLSANGMNLTRIYPGGMFEPPDKYLPGNPLGPGPGKQILPWKRSTEAGANPALAEPGQPSFKFDLDQWNPDYFARLKAFVRHAHERNIVVEVAFFNGMYADCWPLMAMYHGNNIQKVGRYEAAECGLFTSADPRNQSVIPYQKAYVAKITRELNEFDNLIYDLCDEPSLEGLPDGKIVVHPDSWSAPWLQELKAAFLDAEKGLAKKHILGQTVQNLSPDFSAEPWCDWLPTEYVGPAGRALEKDYAANKPLVDVESDYFGYGLAKPYTADDVRVEGWWFMLSGGAGFINLNGEYSARQESGGEITRSQIVPQKRVLKAFLDSLELVRMSRFTAFTGVPSGAFAGALAQPGRQYALYLFHGTNDGQWGAHFIAKSGRYRDKVVFEDVPAGRYAVKWLDPATGVTLSSEVVQTSGGPLELTSPEYSLDIAIRIDRRD